MQPGLIISKIRT